MSPGKPASLRCALPMALLLPVLACSGDSGTPTEPSGAPLTLTSAAVSVDGTVYNGGTFHHGQGHGTSTRFEAQLRFLDGRPAAGEQVWIDFRHGGGMMGPGRFALFDDGTHGDLVPGDGLYCLEDEHGNYGFHHAGADRGEYHYDFWGEHHDGGTSNHMLVTIQVAD